MHFWHYNTSKRGVTLNLESASGVRLFRELVDTADVLIESYAPGYLPSLGLDYESLQTSNPRLIMCSLTPFGQQGPWAHFNTSDLIHLAAGGQMGESGYDEADAPGQPPIAPGGGNAWHIGSHYAYIGIMAAVFTRGLTGDGQYIDASVHDACALTTEGGVTTWIYSHQVRKRQTGRHAAPQPTGQTQFLCKDGVYVNTLMFGLRVSPSLVKTIAEWFGEFGLAEDLSDPRYEDEAHVGQQTAHILDVARRFFAGVTSDIAYHGAQQRGFPLGPVRAPEEILQDQHFRDRGFFVEVEHPELARTFEYPGAAAIYHASPWRISRRAPLIGEHNIEVFGALGVSTLEVAVLRESGAI
ncbi:MAG: CoA transferase [Chloroflexi bacterium]|nr:CoA transferase [Chloroflexota bacterium]